MKDFALGLMRWWAGAGPVGAPGHLVSRWLFLRALGVIYFSVFYSLLFQIRGMLGPGGLLPAGSYLEEVAKVMGRARYWYAPTVFWLGSGNHALIALCWAGIIASGCLIFNFWPRLMLAVCFVCFLSFIAAAEDFAAYQSDGMLLGASFISLFLAPRGWRPRWGEKEPPSRAPLFLLCFLWFTIYFESGVAKYLGGDPAWRNLTAMNEYYQNGPLPTWIGWYAHQLPDWCHEATAFLTLLTELAVVWLLWFPRRAKILCFFVVTFIQLCIILTANYAFLNYLVVALGIFLLDDLFLIRFVPQRWAGGVRRSLDLPASPLWYAKLLESFSRGEKTPFGSSSERPRLLEGEGQNNLESEVARRGFFSVAGLSAKSVLLLWVFYAMFFLLIQHTSPRLPLPIEPVTALEPFRIANSYGLFGRMTWFRYEIEFQGSSDGTNWVAYPFRYKPQGLDEAPGIYAPYQPRFEWNLWFASLATWRENPFVLRTEQQLLFNNPDVLALFRSNPFSSAPPKFVRSVIWQYWFTDRPTKRATGQWWRREYRGLYAPVLERNPDHKIIVSEWPQTFIPPP